MRNNSYFILLLLNSLGQTSDEIYLSLKNKKIKGKKASLKNCPIANYIKSSDRSFQEKLQYVGLENIQILNEKITLPNSIKEFIYEFDKEKSKYFDLVE